VSKRQAVGPAWSVTIPARPAAEAARRGARRCGRPRRTTHPGQPYRSPCDASGRSTRL